MCIHNHRGHNVPSWDMTVFVSCVYITIEDIMFLPGIWGVC